MYEKRRKKLLEEMPSFSITLFFSGKAPYKVGDEKYEFSVDRNFYYYTGLDKENMILALCKAKDVTQELLFIEQYDESLAKWVGGRMMPDEASEVSGIEHIRWVEEAMETVAGFVSRYQDTTDRVSVYADFKKQEPYQEDRPAFTFCRELINTNTHSLANFNECFRFWAWRTVERSYHW